MSEPFKDDGTQDASGAPWKSLMDLFNLPDKASVDKFARTAVIDQRGFFQWITLARRGGLEGYKYANHFRELVHPDKHPTEKDHAALTANGVGPLSREASTAVRKLFQVIKDRRQFAAHLFYTPHGDYWHLFYFDQRDLSKDTNHWLKGPHVHYVRESYTQKPLDQVWRELQCTPPIAPRGTHLAYRESTYDDAQISPEGMV
jgi:hypothetical protein